LGALEARSSSIEAGTIPYLGRVYTRRIQDPAKTYNRQFTTLPKHTEETKTYQKRSPYLHSAILAPTPSPML
jgi:hypothetical protein